MKTRTTDVATSPSTLPSVLGPVEALCVVVGSVIGSGIFLVPSTVARGVPFLGGIILVWIVGGLFSAAGAITLAELGSMLPRAGGPYVYLRAAYGPLPAFLFGWTEFLIARAGSMATLAAAFARYFAQIAPAPSGLRPEIWQAGAAVLAIGAVTAVNVLGTRNGGLLQVTGTALKVGGVLVLMVLPLVTRGGSVANFGTFWPAAASEISAVGVLTAMVGVLWAYDGWVNLASLSEEIREPNRNIPLALLLGMLVLVGIYLAMTVAYHFVLPISEVASASAEKGVEKAVAAIYCQRLLGQPGVVAISLLVMASTLISLNGNALTGPRASFAMARDGLFPALLGRVHPRYQTPSNAILAQGAWAIVLTIAGTALIIVPAPASESPWPGPIRVAWARLNETPLYDLLYTYVIFGATVFYLLAIASVFVLRVRRPELPRPYRTWGYPVTPLVYVLASVLLLGNMLRRQPAESLAGLSIILMGVPVYLAMKPRRARENRHEGNAAPPS